MIRFDDNASVAELKPVIVSYLKEAMSYAAAGIKPPEEQREIALPDELVEALDADSELAEAFHRLTPGRQLCDQPEFREEDRNTGFTHRQISRQDHCGEGATER